MATPWTVARSAINHIYTDLYYVNHPQSLIESDHFHYLPAEEIEDLVIISFVLRYRPRELGNAPHQLNINVRGNELPGDLHDGLVINLRTGNGLMSHICAHNVVDITDFGGLAEITKNPTGIKVHEINEGFIKYLLGKFGNRRLVFLANSNWQDVDAFCKLFSIKEPFASSCCIVT